MPWTTTYLERGVDPEHLRTHPEVAVLAAQVEVAQAEVRLVRANMEADWTVELNYAQRGSAYANMVSVGVTIPLQIDQAGRQDQELRARLALLDAAQARYDDMLRSHESEVRVMLNDWLAGKERVARFAAAIVPLAGQRAEAALTAYRTGKGDLGAVLAARRDELDMRVQALAVEQEAARTWAQLSFLSADHANPEMHQDKP